MHHAMSPEPCVVQDRVHGKAQYHAFSPELYVVQRKWPPASVPQGGTSYRQSEVAPRNFCSFSEISKLLIDKLKCL